MTHRLSTVAAASLALLPLAMPSQAQNAPANPLPSFPRGDAGHSGYTSDTLPTPISLLWRHTTTAAHGNASSPAYANDVVYFGSGQHFYAVKSTDGSLLWQFPASGDATGSFTDTATVVNGSVYVGSDNGQVYKIDAKTGAQAWARKVGGAIRSSPIVDGGLVYFGSADRSAYAVSADTGQIVWSAATTGAITASPTLYNGAVVFASSDNSLYAYNPTTGRVAWSEPLPSDPSTSPPVSDGSQLYVGSGQTLYALQGRGGLRWSKSLGSELSAPATAGGSIVYAVTQDRVVYALATGSVADRNRIRWSRRLDYPSYAPPLLAGGILLVPTQHGILYGLDAQTGALKWQYVIQPAATASQPKYAFTDIASAPVWANKTLYVLSDDGTLSAFRSEAVDKVGPQATSLSPAPGLAVAGIRVPYGATLVDEGSGIDPASVSLQIDQSPVALAKYDPSKNGVAVDLSKDTRGDSSRPLADGSHQVTLKAKDWHGNAMTKTWAFVVDNTLNPPSIPTPGTLIDPTPDNSTPGRTQPPPPATSGSTGGPSIPRGSGGRDPDGGVNGGPPPPPPIDGPGGGGGTPPPPTPPGGGGNPPPPTPPTPPTPPGGGGGGAPPPPAPPV